MINITRRSGDVIDTHHRYQMPLIAAKREGKGVGKTILTNISDISRHLQRSPDELMRFFSIEMGARSVFVKARKVGCINGAHSAKSLQQHLGKYIDHFVICQGCGIPETSYFTDKNFLYQDCAACGAIFPIVKHRLAESVYRRLYNNRRMHHPPDMCLTSIPLKQKQDDIGEDFSGPTETDSDDEDGLKLNSRILSNVSCIDPSTPSPSMSSLPQKTQLVLKLIDILTQNADSYPVGGVESSVRRGLTQMTALFQASPCDGHTKQRALVAAAEWTCGWKYPSLVSLFPVILLHLYELDLLDEEFILDQWAMEDGTGKCVEYIFHLLDGMSIDGVVEIHASLRATVRPLILWLQEADVEEEGEGEGGVS